MYYVILFLIYSINIIFKFGNCSRDLFSTFHILMILQTYVFLERSYIHMYIWKYYTLGE